MVDQPGPYGRGTALVLIDLQNAYFEFEPLAQHRGRLVDEANRLVRWAREEGALVVNVRTEHQRDKSTWTLNMLEDDQGFAFVGNQDAQPLEGLDLEGSVEVVKTRDDAFLGTHLGDLLREREIGTLVVAGVSTHTCVGTTVTHAYALGLSCVLVHDAIASHRPELHRPTIDMLADEFRLPVVDVAGLLGGGLPRRQGSLTL